MTTRRQITIDIDPEVDISIFLVKQMKTLDLSSPYYGLHTSAKAQKIKEMIGALDLIEAIAWEEHASDWDLSLSVEIETGTITTAPGYSLMEIKDGDLIIEDAPSTNVPYDENSEPHHWTLPISKIKSITCNED